MKAEHTVNLGVTVKVEFGDTTLNLMDRLLKILENKIILDEEPTKKKNNIEKVLETMEAQENESKENEVALKQIQAEVSEIRKNEKNNVLKEISEDVRLNKLTDEKETEKIVETKVAEISLEQLRAELSEIREKGGKELIKELLEYVGANKLSDVKKEDYEKLMKKIKEVK